ncbi:hypothetical protein GALMADRAFT_249851 [Galerina marginata CBS 339.88]|uniref:Uncharacterized protein n=1 Tax=Galerina marginata (strain CBS 339.88) TaxID=685588 RepID=A0A067SVL4_GALM3|nr:hypothetical protein GALMADRAFT_249851 [Galerina marginata CBS 339.88]
MSRAIFLSQLLCKAAPKDVLQAKFWFLQAGSAKIGKIWTSFGRQADPKIERGHPDEVPFSGSGTVAIDRGPCSKQLGVVVG